MQGKVKWLIFLSVLAIVIIFVIFFLPKIIGDIVYPLNYKNEIKRWSQTYNVDGNLIAGIIKIESGFNPKAHSHAGAMGLMQIIPGTGAGLARQLGFKNFSYNDLYDPNTSIRFGTYYIKQLIDKYNGNVDLALTAYNGGVSAADYVATYSTKSGLSTETQTYAGKVKRSWTSYRQLYGNWWKKTAATAKKQQRVAPLSFLGSIFSSKPSLSDLILSWLINR